MSNLVWVFFVNTASVRAANLAACDFIESWYLDQAHRVIAVSRLRFILDVLPCCILKGLKKLALLYLATRFAFAQSPADKGEEHEFIIHNFQTESGVTLPQARIMYGTYGKLNAARDNAVLLPSHYMAKFRGYEWLIGPGKCLDTSQLFLVATELFGNGRSSSPSNTPEPLHGPRFPSIDNSRQRAGRS